MRQILKSSSLLAVFMIGLTACNTNNDTALQNKRTEEALPIGYYSNENHEKSGGNAIILEGSDNDGPLIEIMDHTLGEESDMNKRVMRSKQSEPNRYKSTSYNNQSHERVGEPILGERDTNYHGHLNNTNSPQRKSYYTGYEGADAERITASVQGVKNVKDARTIVYGKNIIIGVQLADGKLEEETKRNVHEAVKRYVNGKKVYYVSNESRFNAIKVIDNELKNGGSKEEINADIEQLILSLEPRNR